MSKGDSEKKPFYKNKLFVIIAIIAVIAIMYYAVNNVQWFQRLFGEI